MKKHLKTLSVVLIVLGLFQMVLGDEAIAAPAQQNVGTTKDRSQLWQEIVQAGQKSARIKVQWTLMSDSPASPLLNPEEAAANAYDQRIKEGRSEWEAKGYADAIRGIVEQSRRGYTQKATLTFVRIGGTFLCRGDVALPVTKGEKPVPEPPDPLGLSKFIDFYDGKHALTFEGIPDNEPPRGYLSVVKEDIMLHSAPREIDRIFLADSPLASYFSPDEIVQGTAAGDEIVLEKRREDPVFPRLYRLVFSRKMRRPTRLSVINLVNDKLIETYTSSDFRDYGEYGWFPQKIERKPIGAKGITDEYSLVNVIFGAAVSDKELLLKYGSEITDNRFGESRRYPIGEDGKIRSDEEVKELLKKDPEEEFILPEEELKRQTLSMLSGPSGGLFLICLGVGIFGCSRVKLR